MFDILEYPIPIIPPWPLRGYLMLLTSHPDVVYVAPEFCERPIGSIIPPLPFWMLFTQLPDVTFVPALCDFC